MCSRDDHALAIFVGYGVVRAVTWLLLKMGEQLRCEPDAVREHDHLTLLGKPCDTQCDLVNTSIVETIDRIIKDDRGGNQSERRLREEVRDSDDLLLALRKDLRRSMLRRDDLAPRGLTAPARKLKTDRRCSQRLALLYKAALEVSVEKLLASCLGHFRQRP